MRKIKRMADAFRIWQVGNPKGWDVTVAELADATGLSEETVRRHCTVKGWLVKMPRVRRAYRENPYNRPAMRIENVRSLLGWPSC